MVALVKRTNAGGQLIDGIGTQMHLSVRRRPQFILVDVDVKRVIF